MEHPFDADRRAVRNLDLGIAQRTLIQSLDALFAKTGLPSTIRRRQSAAYGWAYFALARLVYSVPHDMRNARRFLLQGAAVWPPIIRQTDWVMWLARALLGFETIQRLKKRLYADPTGVQHAPS